jgi:hypothetical protein
MVGKRFPLQPVSLLEQIAMMKRYFPEFHWRWKQNVVTWIGEIQPAPLSRRYRVRIIHQLYRAPDVYVLQPQLVNGRNDESLPHTYPGDRLCLYHPQKREWSQQRHIATTIVPWTSLWLFYYEIWQVTGDWMGGGEHPNLSKQRQQSLIYELNHLSTETDKTPS